MTFKFFQPILCSVVPTPYTIYHTPINQYSNMLREFWHGFLDEKSNRLVMPRALRDSERQRQWHKKKKSETESKLRNRGALEPGSPLAFELGFALLYYFFSFQLFILSTRATFEDAYRHIQQSQQFIQCFPDDFAVCFIY